MAEAIVIVEQLVQDTFDWYRVHKARGKSNQIECAAIRIRLKALHDVLAALRMAT